MNWKPAYINNADIETCNNPNNNSQLFGINNQQFGNNNLPIGNNNQQFGNNNQPFDNNNQPFGNNTTPNPNNQQQAQGYGHHQLLSDPQMMQGHITNQAYNCLPNQLSGFNQQGQQTLNFREVPVNQGVTNETQNCHAQNDGQMVVQNNSNQSMVNNNAPFAQQSNTTVNQMIAQQAKIISQSPKKGQHKQMSVNSNHNQLIPDNVSVGTNGTNGYDIFQGGNKVYTSTAKNNGRGQLD
jgi:hypothetical protein